MPSEAGGHEDSKDIALMSRKRPPGWKEQACSQPWGDPGARGVEGQTVSRDTSASQELMGRNVSAEAKALGQCQSRNSSTEPRKHQEGCLGRNPT